MKRILANVTDKEVQKLKEIALKNNTTMTDLVTQIIRNYLKEAEKK